MGKKRVLENEVDEEPHEINDETAKPSSNEISLKKKSGKPLPPGYICNACKGTGHAIHDCPLKVSKKPKKVQKTVDESSESQVVITKRVEKSPFNIYITGLPFNTTNEKLISLLEEEGCEVTTVKLIAFEDNAKKCKGTAFVAVSEESSEKALAMNGRTMGTKTLKVEWGE